MMTIATVEINLTAGALCNDNNLILYVNKAKELIVDVRKRRNIQGLNNNKL